MTMYKNLESIFEQIKNMKEDCTNCVVTSEKFMNSILESETYELHMHRDQIKAIEALEDDIKLSVEERNSTIYKVWITLKDKNIFIFNHSFIILQDGRTFQICDSWEGVHKFECWRVFDFEDFMDWLSRLKYIIRNTFENKVFNGPMMNDLFQMTKDRWGDAQTELAEEEYIQKLPMFRSVRVVDNVKARVQVEKVQIITAKRSRSLGRRRSRSLGRRRSRSLGRRRSRSLGRRSRY
jgi:hypothetical protein